MAKGFGSRGIPGMGGGMNMNMIKQAQKMQQDMLKMQQELEEKTYEASAGGGVVTASVSGKRELKSLTIDPDAVDPDDVGGDAGGHDRGRRQRGPAGRGERRRLQHAETHRRAGPALLSNPNTAKSPAGMQSSRGFSFRSPAGLRPLGEPGADGVVRPLVPAPWLRAVPLVQRGVAIARHPDVVLVEMAALGAGFMDFIFFLHNNRLASIILYSYY